MALPAPRDPARGGAEGRDGRHAARRAAGSAPRRARHGAQPVHPADPVGRSPDASPVAPAPRDPPKVRAAKYAGYLLWVAGVVAFSFLAGTQENQFITNPGELLIPLTLYVALRALAYALGQGISEAPWDRVVPRLIRGLSLGFLFYWTADTFIGEPVVGIIAAVLVVGIALYNSYGELKALGFAGSAPLAGILASTAIGGGVWLVLRLIWGEYVWFTAVSLLFALLYIVAVVTFVTASQSRAVARVKAAREGKLEPPKASRAPLWVAIGAYLVFRLFISAQIPYGPIFEWIAICVGITIFAYAASKRIGIVPTKHSLPPPRVRLHEQKVEAKHDPDLQRLETLVGAFIQRGVRRKDLAREVEAALLARGHAEDDARAQAQRVLAHRPERGGLLSLTAGGKALRDRNATERSKLLSSIDERLRTPGRGWAVRTKSGPRAGSG